jgi:hypothetical protein
MGQKKRRHTQPRQDQKSVGAIVDKQSKDFTADRPN